MFISAYQELRKKNNFIASSVIVVEGKINNIVSPLCGLPVN